MAFYIWLLSHCFQGLPMYQYFIPSYGQLNSVHQYSIFCLTIHQLVDISVILIILNNAATNFYVQVFGWAYVFSSLGFILRSGMAGLNGNFMFNYSSNLQTLISLYYI